MKRNVKIFILGLVAILSACNIQNRIATSEEGDPTLVKTPSAISEPGEGDVLFPVTGKDKDKRKDKGTKTPSATLIASATSTQTSILEATPTPSAREIFVSNSSELQDSLNNSRPGDVIILSDGNYSGNINIANSGSSTEYITLKPQTTNGVLFNNADLVISGNFVRIEGFRFEENGINVSGNYNSISRNLFQNADGHPAIDLLESASFNIISYNEITNWNGYGIRLRGDSGMTGNIIDHNYIHDNIVISGAEAIKVGRGRPTTFFKYNTLIQYNLFENIDTDEENEIISVKSSDNIIQFNTFKNSGDNVLMGRHGINNKFIYNYLINISIRVIGDNHTVMGNHIEGGNLKITSGDCVQDDVPKGGGCSPAAQYQLVSNNFLTGGAILLGAGGSPYPAKDNILVCNQAKIKDMGNHVGTQILPDENCDIDRTILLTPNMVGPNASLQ